MIEISSFSCKLFVEDLIPVLDVDTFFDLQFCVVAGSTNDFSILIIDVVVRLFLEMHLESAFAIGVVVFDDSGVKMPFGFTNVRGATGFAFDLVND